MKPYVRLYLDYFGYDDFVPSEISGERAVDIHHIEARGMGGTSKPDRIENLMALTRKEHELYGDKKEYFEFLAEVHAHFLKTRIPWNYGKKRRLEINL